MPPRSFVVRAPAAYMLTLYARDLLRPVEPQHHSRHPSSLGPRSPLPSPSSQPQLPSSLFASPPPARSYHDPTPLPQRLLDPLGAPSPFLFGLFATLLFRVLGAHLGRSVSLHPAPFSFPYAASNLPWPFAFLFARYCFFQGCYTYSSDHPAKKYSTVTFSSQIRVLFGEAQNITVEIRNDARSLCLLNLLST